MNYQFQKVECISFTNHQNLRNKLPMKPTIYQVEDENQKRILYSYINLCIFHNVIHQTPLTCKKKNVFFFLNKIL